MGRIETASVSAIDPHTISAQAHQRIVQVRDAMRAVSELVHAGTAETWCDEAPVSRGDLSALIALLGDQLETAIG